MPSPIQSSPLVSYRITPSTWGIAPKKPTKLNERVSGITIQAIPTDFYTMNNRVAAQNIYGAVQIHGPGTAAPSLEEIMLQAHQQRSDWAKPLGTDPLMSSIIASN